MRSMSSANLKLEMGLSPMEIETCSFKWDSGPSIVPQNIPEDVRVTLSAQEVAEVGITIHQRLLVERLPELHGSFRPDPRGVRVQVHLIRDFDAPVLRHLGKQSVQYVAILITSPPDPSDTACKKSLKLKLQNALSKTAADADAPAVFVGGRRRNRKKRKPKHGQTKKKTNEVSTVPKVLNRSFTHDFEYYQDFVRPAAKVSCLDIEEPVFIEKPKQVFPTRRDSGCDEDFEDDSEPAITIDTSAPLLKDICRTHSRDSGVYDGDVTMFTDDGTSDLVPLDDQTSDEGIESMAEANASDCSAESVEHGDRRNDVHEDIADDIAADEFANRHLDSTDEQFDEIDLDSEYEDEHDSTLGAVPLSVELAQAYVKDYVTDDAIQVTGADATDAGVNVTEADRFLKLLDDEDEVIFDLSQLEVNNTERELSTIERWRQQLRQNNKKSGSIFNPTVLESDEPIRVPMDLLIDDDKDDEVLYEAGGARRDLNITCNPLYEQTLQDEEKEKISLKNFQSGFQTDFDNVNFIQIPTKPGGKKTKESSPLLKNGESENADELACCTIL